VFTVRYVLSPYIKQIRFVFKGLNYTIPEDIYPINTAVCGRTLWPWYSSYLLTFSYKRQNSDNATIFMSQGTSPSLTNNSDYYLTLSPLYPTPHEQPHPSDAHSSSDRFLMQLKCCRVKDLYGNFCMMSIDYFSFFSILKCHPKWKKRVPIISAFIILHANCWQV
jgi:hypothetical protein